MLEWEFDFLVLPVTLRVLVFSLFHRRMDDENRDTSKSKYLKFLYF